MKSMRVLWVGLMIAGVMLLASISPVRALIQGLVTTLAGQSYLETEDYPGYGDDMQIIEPQNMSLNAALATFPYSVKLPTNIPDEFILDEDDVSLYTGEQGGPFSEMIEIQWISDDNASLNLHISDKNWNSTQEVVAPGSIEEILLADGTPAVLIRGGWNYDQKTWDNTIDVLRLRWQTDGLNYDLRGYGENVSIEQLIAIASSTLK